MTAPVTFDQFREQWLEEVRQGDPSTVELGRRFARKLLTQWLEADDSSDDLVYCDGSGDGGIDIAYLDRASGSEGEGSDDQIQTGHTWYLVQSKYGHAFQGVSTLIEEGQKITETLDGHRQRLSSLAEGLLERLTNFRRQASERDRIVVVFGTETPLTDEEKRALADVRAMGRQRLGALFDAESVSIDTIYRRAVEEEAAGPERLRVPIRAKLVSSGEDLLVGSVSLLSLYDFLKAYRDRTGDLDELYEKNVRRFLGGRRKVNQAINETLRQAPERFGLYNNGITIVVADFRPNGDGVVELIDPYVVNGCQTTRTIWEVFHQRLEAGGTGASPELEDWRRRAEQGVVVTKIAKVGDQGESLLQAITRYTNSQNAIREKDFLALTSDFRSWAKQMAERYGVYFEIQRGGWDSRLALQKQKPEVEQFKEAANAFDLLKVYGSGWLREAGLAFGKNAPFLPSGVVFKRIMNAEATAEPFGVDDLYASFRLMRAADGYGFGRGAKLARRQTRFLFYMVALDLLRDVMTRSDMPTTGSACTRALVKLFSPDQSAVIGGLLDAAIEVIDSYLTQGTDSPVFDEPAFKNTFNFDLNAFLKWERLGKTEEDCPQLRTLLAVTKQAMGRRVGGQPTVRDTLKEAMR